MNNSIGKSKEDYLKTILMLKKEYGACRVADVSKKMNVSMASASAALKKLEQDGFVTKDDWRVLLSERGTMIAEELYEKDVFLCELFLKLGVSKETAKKDACLVEHALSDETYQKIKDYLQRKAVGI